MIHVFDHKLSAYAKLSAAQVTDQAVRFQYRETITKPKETNAFYEVTRIKTNAEKNDDSGYGEDLTPNDAKLLLAYAKLLYDTPQNNLENWGLVREAAQLPNSQLVQRTVLEYPSITSRCTAEELQDRIQRLTTEIQTKLTPLAKRYIQQEIAKHKLPNPRVYG